MTINIVYLVICIGVGLAWRRWRLNNLRGKHKGEQQIPKGHNVYIFNPYTMTIKEIKRQSIARNESRWNPSDYQYYQEFPTIKYNDNFEVAIIALNLKNAIKKARNLLNFSGYGPEYKTVNIQST